ncbi:MULTISPECIES: KaiC domain-containing protein [Haloferax]|uniref:KaiC domain-containing protein n=2 Tax=Haloferax TaxID=2251 RepID=A0A6G1Z1P5_9EURY|nr:MULTISPECIES: KaiC domain-containing protein [Haloferax]KAB1187698.1 KaiC domain-containing protein [Haloferax sp. CBA1149]MRW80358.1 KaiC domain-containing protein [Haloferax marinisediminis]
MSDDDDWFERALRERRDDTDEAAADPETVELDDENHDHADRDGRSDDESASGSPANDSDGAAAPADSMENAGDDPFSTNFAEAFKNAPMPDIGDSDDEFGGSAGSGMGDDFHFDSNATRESLQFDDDDFESDIDRIDIGIEGLDEMILGGVPERSLMVTIGSAGTGKTTFGLQFLYEALKNGDNAVYITLEESRSRILDTADEKGWQFSEYEADGNLAIVDLDPVEMANSLSSIRNDLPRLVDEFDADRLVLDSVSLLEMMYDHPSKRRSEVFDFTRSLKDAGVTTMLTSEADQTNPYVSRHGIVEYLSDAVFVLQYVRPDDFRETRLAIEIQKIRDANHSRETKPYELTSEGISVYRQANIF